ncbi:MAG: toll/interleukin-1 receptor domain-containing protein [Lachnospiraceae bacterium]|nr:toll/interleukin-1 receptor domain-containing protein [Lachnospiraceae bacterium]
MKRYLAFISYRHQERDIRISTMIRRGIENWHLPKDSVFYHSNRRCFRDTDELPTSSDLGTDIENALEDSEWLIALCSEAYIESLWCNKEIERYIEKGRKGRILIILTGNNPEESIPESIKDLPFIARVGTGERNADTAIAALLGHMDKCSDKHFSEQKSTSNDPSDETGQSYMRAQKRFRLFRNLIAVFAAELIILGFTLYANYSADRIAKNNDMIRTATAAAISTESIAKEERDNALLMNARMLSMQAWNELGNGNNDQAVKLALSALPEDLHGDEPVSDEAVSVLRAALSSPDKPVDTWKYVKSYKTDFNITDCISKYRLKNGLLLLSENTGIEEYLLDHENGNILAYDSDIRKNALSEGYSNVCYGEATDIFYGPEKPLKTTYRPSLIGNLIDYNLDGRPIYADHVVEDSYNFVTWLENPIVGKESPVCLIDITKADVIALDVPGIPVSAGFSRNGNRLGIVSNTGVLSFINAYTGKKESELPGFWSEIYFPDSNLQFACIDAEGKAFIYDAMTMTPVFTLESPTRIKSLQNSRKKEIYIALCEDAVRIYDANDGTLKQSLSLPKTDGDENPAFMIFEKYDEYLWTFDGNAFYLIYDRRIDKYQIETETDVSGSDYLPLYREGLFSDCSKAFYSHDSRFVYRQEYHGELSKWDAKTGEFIWANTEMWMIQGNVHDNAIESADGKYLWRVSDEMDGMEKINAETGETEYSTCWKEQTGNPGSLLMPRETSGKTAVCPTKYGTELVAFDKDNGDFLWIVNDGGEVFCFSEDESLLYAFAERKEGESRQLVRRVISMADGTIISEDVLWDVPAEKSERFWLYLDTKHRILACETDATEHLSPDHDNDKTVTEIVTFDTVTGSETGSWTIGHKAYFGFSYSGKLSARWTDPSDDDEYCVELLPNGECGQVITTASEEGRVLTTMDQNNVDLVVHAGRKLGKFCGDDVYTETEALAIRMVRITDGAVMLNLPSVGITRYAELAPDGSGLVIYGDNNTPRIILASDTDTLVKKARKHLEDIQ